MNGNDLALITNGRVANLSGINMPNEQKHNFNSTSVTKIIVQVQQTLIWV